MSIVILLTMQSCKKQSLAEKVHKIKVGMTIEDIAKILGNSAYESNERPFSSYSFEERLMGAKLNKEEKGIYKKWELKNPQNPDALDVFDIWLDSSDGAKNTVPYNELSIDEIQSRHIEQIITENSKTDLKQKEKERQEKEQREKNKPCIYCFDAIERVKSWALIKQAQGISITYASSEWECRETKIGCYVKATFYMNSQQVDREFFVNCNGEVN